MLELDTALVVAVCSRCPTVTRSVSNAWTKTCYAVIGAAGGAFALWFEERRDSADGVDEEARLLQETHLCPGTQARNGTW